MSQNQHCSTGPFLRTWSLPTPHREFTALIQRLPLPMSVPGSTSVARALPRSLRQACSLQLRLVEFKAGQVIGAAAVEGAAGRMLEQEDEAGTRGSSLPAGCHGASDGASTDGCFYWLLSGKCSMDSIWTQGKWLFAPS